MIDTLLIRILLFFFLSFSVYAGNTLQINIHGIRGDILTNVNTRLLAEKQTYGKNISDEQIQTFFKNARQEISQAIQPYGYFQPKIKSYLSHHENMWIASFNIELGLPIKIKKIEVKVSGPGKNNPQLQRFLHNFPLHAGQIFATVPYEKAKEELFHIANNQGYIKAFLDNNTVLVNTNNHEAVIMLHLQTGPRYYFGPFVFSSTPYDNKFLNRFIHFKENEPFSSQKLILLQQELGKSFYFRQVVATPDFKQTKNYRVPIRMDVIAPKSQRYNLGVGYGSFTGPRLTAGIKLRRITNDGHHFDAQIKLSSVLSALVAKYYIPGKNPLTDQWIIDANYSKFSPKNGQSNAQTIFAGYHTKIYNVQSGLDLNYLRERYQIENNPTKNGRLFYPSLNLAYTKTDDPIDVHFGKSFNLMLRGGSKNILSATSFFQAEVKGKYVFSPTEVSRVILRGDVGYTAVKNLNALPLSMRFFAGGINSIRGFGDSSIGPGRYLEVASIEYQHRVIGNFSAAVFYDVGNATNKWGQPLNRGAGVGVIYNSMIGPIKLYLARAESKPGKPRSVEFSIGPEF